MNRIYWAVLEIMVSAVVLLPIYIILNQIQFHDIKKSIAYCIFSFYLVAVYSLVGMPNVTYIRFELTLNLIPIVGLIADWKNSILNVLLFVPLGIMLPIIWNKYRACKNTVLFGFGMSLAIECLQIFTFRSTDINDLITNGFGAFLGFSLANILMKIFPTMQSVMNEKKAKELCTVCAVVLVVMFFIHPFLYSIMWDLIL